MSGYRGAAAGGPGGGGPGGGAVLPLFIASAASAGIGTEPAGWRIMSFSDCESGLLAALVQPDRAAAAATADIPAAAAATGKSDLRIDDLLNLRIFFNPPPGVPAAPGRQASPRDVRSITYISITAT